MDELSFIREQVRTERRHMAEVRSALEAALAHDAAQTAAASSAHDFILATARYLVFAVQRFNAQDQKHCEQLRPRLGDAAGAATSAATKALDDLTQTLARSRNTIAALQVAVTSAATADPQSSASLRSACASYLDFYKSELLTQTGSLSPLLEQHYSAADWRRASMVDAESILEERDLYDAVRSALPSGIELKSAGRPPATQSA